MSWGGAMVRSKRIRYRCNDRRIIRVKIGLAVLYSHGSMDSKPGRAGTADAGSDKQNVVGKTMAMTETQIRASELWQAGGAYTSWHEFHLHWVTLALHTTERQINTLALDASGDDKTHFSGIVERSILGSMELLRVADFSGRRKMERPRVVKQAEVASGIPCATWKSPTTPGSTDKRLV